MSNQARQFHPLEQLDQLSDGYRRVFTIGELDLLLLQHAGRIYLLNNICPHAGYPMHEGKIIGDTIRCPMHGYLFRLENGACTYSSEGPCRALPAYPLQIRGSMLGVVL